VRDDCTGLDRIVIVGTTGSGKSTLAGALAAMTGAEHIELDALNHQPAWQHIPLEEFRARVDELAAQPRWIVDGNYVETTEHILWPHAQLIVWLDLPLRTVLRRLIRRSVTRIIRRTELWQGNRETLAMLFSRKSIVLWAVKSNARHRRELPVKLSPPVLRSVAVVRLTRPLEVEAWLASFRGQSFSAEGGRSSSRAWAADTASGSSADS
jgi:adenylate kinase family enzyme